MQRLQEVIEDHDQRHLRKNHRERRNSHGGGQRYQRSAVCAKRSQRSNTLVHAAKISQSGALGCLQKFTFMSGAVRNPFVVKICAVYLPQNSIFENPFAPQFAPGVAQKRPAARARPSQ